MSINLITFSNNELEFSQVLSYISSFCYTQKGREVLFSLSETSFLGQDDYWDEYVSDLSRLDTELQAIDELKIMLTTDEIFPLENLTDVRDAINKTKIEGVVLEIEEIKSIAHLINVAISIKKFMKLRKDTYPTIYGLVSDIFDNNELQKQLDICVDSNGNIRDNATRELYKIRSDIRDKITQLHSKISKIARDYYEEDFTQDDFYTIRDGRFVLPIKANYKRHLSGIIHGTSQTGSTVYLEPSVIVEMNNDLTLLQSAELQEIHRILQSLTTIVAKFRNQLLGLYDTISHIDIINAKATYALKYGGIKPIITEEKVLELNKVYHPILLQQKKGTSKRLNNESPFKEVIPISITFSDKQRGHLISGPNAGGKTIAMKTIGLSVLMATNGIFPLGEVRLYHNFSVYTSIGDGQSIENNLSTFSFQLTRIKQILDLVDHNSIVLIDEICSGTDPREGSALASGIIDTFIELNLFFFVTTHQSSLKTYALNNKDAVLVNGSFEFDEEKLCPTYKFQSGIPGNSYAFFLAKNIGFSNLVMKRAKKYLGSRQKQLEKSIVVLSKNKKMYEELLLEKRKEVTALKESIDRYDAENRKLKESKTKILADAKIEAKNILLMANNEVEKTITELKKQFSIESKLAAKNIQSIKKDFTKFATEISEQANTEIRNQLINEQNNSKYDVVINLICGQYVAMFNADGSISKSVGVVLEADNENKKAVVTFNGKKFHLPYSRLLLSNKTDIPQNKTRTSRTDFSFEINTELDLRGDRMDGAIKKLEQFISDAIEKNTSSVRIIHGKGEGILRQAVHNYLGTNDNGLSKNVVSYRLGDNYEGGDGVTIIQFK